MIKKIKGIYVTKSHTPGGDGDHSTGHTTYNIVLEDNTMFSVTESYGSCYSGYTSASWGSTNNELRIADLTVDFDYIPVKDIFVTVASDKVVTKITEPNQGWDAFVTSVMSTDDEVIIYDTDDGGCNYYSSGTAHLNEELFSRLEIKETGGIVTH